MAINVVVNTSSGTTAVVKPSSKSVANVSVLPSSNISLGTLTNVDVSNPDDNDVLRYDAANNKYVVAPIVLDANTTITNINGGLF